MDYKEIWEKIISELKERVNEATFQTWFSNIKYIDFINNVFILEVPSEFNKNIMNTSHSQKISDVIKDIAGENCQYFIITEKEKIDYKNMFKEKKENISKEKQELKNNLIKKYTFEEFVIGSNNRFAHAAAISVANNPGSSYNPLFIYGQVGIGKTHLIQAIAHKVSNDYPEKKINYITSEHFTNEVVESIKNNKTAELKTKYRSSDVLIIDDIQFIAGKKSTQEEFFHTFDHIHRYNKQIIIASDRPPSEIEKLEERLRSRFSSGLICDIQAPDYETRIAILKKKSEAMKIELNDEVCEFMAANIKTNIREFEGALIRVSALSKLTNMPITLEMATETLKDIFTSNQTKEINADLIKEVICRYYGISIKDIESKKRSQNIAFPRQIAMFIIRNLTDMPYVEIGREFGGRDHSTVISAYTKIENEIDKKNSTKKIIDNLILEIKGEN